MFSFTTTVILSIVSYVPLCREHFQKEARKGEELTAFDLFKECHNGKKIGFSEPVKKAIVSF